MRRLIVRGPGLRGPAGRNGLPGVNAVPADEAVAGYVEAVGSETRVALSATVGSMIEDALAGFDPGSSEPPPSPDATWRPAAPNGAERMTGLTFPVVRGSGNYDITMTGGPGTPTPHRLVIAAEFTGPTTIKVFDEGPTGPREWTVGGASESDYADVIEFESQGNCIVQFQVPGGGMTLKAGSSFRQVAATTRYCKLGGDGIGPDFAGGSTLTIDTPIKGTSKRVSVAWAGSNASGDIADLRPAYIGHSVFPESAYVAGIHTRQRNTGSDVPMTVGNNDQIFDVYTAPSPSTTHELRADVHGGETGLTDDPEVDFDIEYDVLGNGTWRTHTVGAPFRQAARVRVTQRTKLKNTSGTLLWHFTKVWTVYADGTVRQDRTSTAQTAHRLRDWYYWMISGDPAKSLAMAALNGTNRIASLAAGDTAAVNYFGGNQSLMYDPAAGVALAIAIDRSTLLSYNLTTPGDSVTAPPPGPRFEDGQLNGDLNKLYTFLRLDTEDVPAGYSISSTQWQRFFPVTDVAYPENDTMESTARPRDMPLTYLAI